MYTMIYQFLLKKAIKMGIKILVKMTLKAIFLAILRHLYNKYVSPIVDRIIKLIKKIGDLMFELLASLTFSDIEYVTDDNTGKTKAKLLFNPIKLIENVCEMTACAATGYLTAGAQNAN